MTRETYITFEFPGSFFAETESHPIESRDIDAALDIFPDRAFSFQFYDKVTQTARREDGKEITIVERENVSPRYYPGGDVYSLERLAKEYGTGSVIYRNTENNHPAGAIKTRIGNFQPYTNDVRLTRNK